MTQPVSIVVAQPVLASDFDAYENLTGAWVAYTPTWASFGTQPVLNNGTIAGKRMVSGNYVAFSIILRPGSTTTFGTNSYTFTLPFSAAGNAVVSAFLEDNSTGFRYAGVGFIDASIPTTISRTVFTNGTGGFSATSPVTLANNDIVCVSGVYEKA